MIRAGVRFSMVRQPARDAGVRDGMDIVFSGCKINSKVTIVGYPRTTTPMPTNLREAELAAETACESGLRKALVRHMRAASPVPEVRDYAVRSHSLACAKEFRAKCARVLRELSREEVLGTKRSFVSARQDFAEHPVKARLKDLVSCVARPSWTGGADVEEARGDFLSASRRLLAARRAADLLLGDMGHPDAPKRPRGRAEREREIAGVVAAKDGEIAALAESLAAALPAAADAFARVNPEIAAWERFLLSHPSPEDVFGYFSKLGPRDPSRALAADAVLRNAGHSRSPEDMVRPFLPFLSGPSFFRGYGFPVRVMPGKPAL